MVRELRLGPGHDHGTIGRVAEQLGSARSPWTAGSGSRQRHRLIQDQIATDADVDALQRAFDSFDAVA